MTLKVVFMGTPEFSIPTLSEILAKGHEVAAVYTQPPRKAGRGEKLRKTPVHEFAEQAGLPVLTPKTLKSEAAQAEFKAHGADVAVVIAYGLILPKPCLEAYPYGCLNIHGSLLPRWRGAAPIQRAIMAGDKETGVMIMQMDEGLDTGDILLADHIPISENMTAGELHDSMKLRGADLLCRALDALERGSLTATPQPETGVTYAEKIAKSETQIIWSKPAEDVHNHIRGLSPFPGAWFEMETADKKIERVKLLKTSVSPMQETPITIKEHQLFVNCGQGALQLLELQRAGKKPMASKDFLNGLQAGFKIKS